MSTLQPTTNFSTQNFFTGYLTADITATSTDIFIDTPPTGSEGTLIIDPDTPASREIIFYNARTSTKVTVPSAALGRGYDGTTATTHVTGTKVIMAPIADWFNSLKTGQISTDPLRTEQFFDFVASGLVWTADAAGSNRNASMTTGVVYIGGKRFTPAAVTARNFTASKDTYIDIDTTGTLVYTEVSNNAASPALAAGSIRIGIIVTAAGSIAAAGSVNQGQEDRVLPIASSIAYTVTDSLGNLICPRDPNRRVLGYRQITGSALTTTSTTAVQATGLTCPVIIPTGRKIKVSIYSPKVTNSGAPKYCAISIWDGTVGSGTQLVDAAQIVSTGAQGSFMGCEVPTTPTATSKTYNFGFTSDSGGGVTASLVQTSISPSYIKVELV